jgi:hypothetical protein
MGKRALFWMAMLIAMLIVPQVLANCYTEPRAVFQVKLSETNQCSFRSLTEKVPAGADVANFMRLRNVSGQFVCNNIFLSADDSKIFIATINQYARNYYNFGSVHIEKQTSSAYENFLNKIYKANVDVCDCKYYGNITRNGTWTTYLEDENCNHDSACRAVPPQGCFSRKVYDATTNVLLMLIITAAVPLALLLILYNMFKA